MTPTDDYNFHTVGDGFNTLWRNFIHWDIRDTQSDSNIDPNSNAQIDPDSSNPIPNSESNQISRASSAGDSTTPGGLDVTGTTPSVPITLNDETSPAAAIPGNLDPLFAPGSNVAANPIPNYSTTLNDPLSLTFNTV